MVNAGQLQLELRDRVKEALLRRHRHQHEKHHKSDREKNRIPNIRSLVDIGRNSSKSMFGSHSKCLFRFVVSSQVYVSLIHTFRMYTILLNILLTFFSHLLLFSSSHFSSTPSILHFHPLSIFVFFHFILTFAASSHVYHHSSNSTIILHFPILPSHSSSSKFLSWDTKRVKIKNSFISGLLLQIKNERRSWHVIKKADEMKKKKKSERQR